MSVRQRGAETSSPLLREILDQKRTLVVVGSGGVGKTTVSAALALHAAVAGARALVLTVDPARRLANALGLESFREEQRPIDLRPLARLGAEPKGTLDAAMLDTKSTFDRVVGRYAPDEETRRRILNNVFYRQASTALAGSEEYMAMEKLYEIRESSAQDYDIVVLDTPPSRHALDFLNAPARMLSAMDSAAFRTFVGSVGRAGRVGGRVNRFLVRGVGRFLGAKVFLDIIEFLESFSGMYDGFAARSRRVEALLRSEDLSFLVVTSPDRAAVEEALFLHSSLDASGMPFGAAVVNRVHLPYLPKGPGRDERATESLARALTASGAAPETARRITTAVVAGHRNYETLVTRDQASLARLREVVGPRQILQVPHFTEDIHDLEGLYRFAEVLFG